MSQPQKQKPLSIQQILVFHEQRLKQLDEMLKSMNLEKSEEQQKEKVAEDNIIRRMAMNQGNFNNELQKFANRVSKVEQLLIDVTFQLSEMKKSMVPNEEEKITLEVKEITEEAKEEVKEEVKEEAKEEVKQEVKEEIKEQLEKKTEESNTSDEKEKTEEKTEEK